MKRALELLSLSNEYRIEKKTYGYDIVDTNSNIVAKITDGRGITYYLSDCYNSGSDYREIDIDSVMKMKSFCEMLIDF